MLRKGEASRARVCQNHSAEEFLWRFLLRVRPWQPARAAGAFPSLIALGVLVAVAANIAALYA